MFQSGFTFTVNWLMRKTGYGFSSWNKCIVLWETRYICSTMYSSLLCCHGQNWITPLTLTVPVTTIDALKHFETG